MELKIREGSVYRQVCLVVVMGIGEKRTWVIIKMCDERCVYALLSCPILFCSLSYPILSSILFYSILYYDIFYPLTLDILSHYSLSYPVLSYLSFLSSSIPLSIFCLIFVYRPLLVLQSSLNKKKRKEHKGDGVGGIGIERKE